MHVVRLIRKSYSESVTYLKLVTTGQMREKKETTMNTIQSVQKLRTCTYIEMTQAAKKHFII